MGKKRQKAKRKVSPYIFSCRIFTSHKVLALFYTYLPLSFAKISLAAAKSDSDDSEEETQSTKTKKKSGASSASMFQTSGEKDKEKKTKKKGRLTDKLMLWLSHWNVSDFCWTF